MANTHDECELWWITADESDESDVQAVACMPTSDKNVHFISLCHQRHIYMYKISIENYKEKEIESIEYAKV